MAPLSVFSWTPSALARACEDLVIEGVVDPKLPPGLAASWTRCRVSGLLPDKDLRSIPLHLDIDRESRLMRAASPVVAHIAERLCGTPTSLVLTDPSARILDRWVGERGLRLALDRVALVAGALYDEEVAGTNGLGTTAEDHKPVQVTGPEHFIETLRGLACAGVPIHHPLTRRFEGVLDLTCRYEDTNALMLPMVLEGAREIERRLLEEASRRERLVLEQFQRIAARSDRAVIAMSEDLVITNATAAGLLEPADHAVLRERAAEALAARQQIVEELVLTGGRVFSIRCRGITEGDRTVGAVVELGRPVSKAARGPRGSQPSVPTPGLVGRSAAHERLCADIAYHASHRLPLLVTGESGVGKLAVARAVHQSAGSGPESIFDAALCGVQEPSEWLGEIQSRLADSMESLIILHVDLLDPARARALCSVIDTQVGPDAARLIATWTVGEEGGGGKRFLLDRFACRIDVPPLRERLDDVPDLVRAFIDKHAAAGAGARCSPGALQALMRLDWPGNVREVETLVCSLLLRRRRGDIGLEDLPPDYQTTGSRRPLTRMERLERDAIINALRACGGNRIEAAAALGVSRSTLYRKMKGYRISADGSLFFES